MLIVVNIPEKKKQFYDLFKDPVFLLAPFLDGRCCLNWLSSPVLSEQMQEDLSSKVKQLVFDQCVLLEYVDTPPTTAVNDADTISSPLRAQISVNSAASSLSAPKRKCLFRNIHNKETKKSKSDSFNSELSNSNQLNSIHGPN